MIYDELSQQIEQLSYRDKFRLAQLLIQLARKEEEEHNPERRQSSTSAKLDPELIQYVAERLRKLKPSRKDSLLNSVGAMFQFQGGIADNDKERMFAELLKRKHIVLTANGRIQYPDV